MQSACIEMFIIVFRRPDIMNSPEKTVKWIPFLPLFIFFLLKVRKNSAEPSFYVEKKCK